MSVANFDAIDGLTELLGDMPETCLYCGKPLVGLTAYWHGASGENVALHPDCGVAFGARITRDALNAKYLAEEKDIKAGVSLGLAKIEP